MQNDLISRSDTIKRAKAAEIEMGSINGIKAVPMDAVIQFLEIVPAVDAVEVPNCEECFWNESIRGWDQCEHCIGNTSGTNNFLRINEVTDDGK